MSFFKTHLPPTLHNAAGTLIASAILAVLAGLVVFIKAFRDFSVPLWSVVLLFAVCLIAAITLSKKKNQKYTTAITDIQKEQAKRQQEITDANTEAQTKDHNTIAGNQKTIERLTGENAEMKWSKEASDQQQTQMAKIYAQEIANFTEAHAQEIARLTEAHTKECQNDKAALAANQKVISDYQQENQTLKGKLSQLPRPPGPAPGSRGTIR